MASDKKEPPDGPRTFRPAAGLRPGDDGYGDFGDFRQGSPGPAPIAAGDLAGTPMPLRGVEAKGVAAGFGATQTFRGVEARGAVGEFAATLPPEGGSTTGLAAGEPFRASVNAAGDPLVAPRAGTAIGEAFAGGGAFEEEDSTSGDIFISPPSGDVVLASASGTVLHDVAVNAQGTTGAVVIPAIWNGTRDDVLFQMDRASQELEAVRLFYRALQAEGVTDPRAHNNPPELLGMPDIDSDLELIEAAIQCLTVLRRLVIQPDPDFDIVALLWRVVVAAVRAMGRLAAWAAQATILVFKKFADTIFGNAYMKSLGTTLGTATGGEIVYEIVKHGPHGLAAVGEILNGVLKVAGHLIG